MSEIKRSPLVACDCCGATAEKREAAYRDFITPDDWGCFFITSRAPEPGEMPSNGWCDLCPDCLTAIEKAVLTATAERKRERAA